MLMAEREDIGVEMIFVTVADENVDLFLLRKLRQRSFGIVEYQHVCLGLNGESAVTGAVDYDHNRLLSPVITSAGIMLS